MTSLIGAAGEDFASILRALGYRMERRPKPPEPPQPPASAAPANETAAPAEPAHAVPDGELPASTQAITADSSASESGVQAESEPALAQPDVSIVEDTASGPAAAPLANEPEMIEVWRPGRMGDRRRVRARQRGRAKQIRGEAAVLPRQSSPENSAPEPGTAASAQRGEDAATTGPAAETDAHAKPRWPVRQRRPEHRMDRQDRQKWERPPGKRFEPREKRPDPNSPFAKLAALKAQLEADAKERR
jgi:ATP-dependent RNA helicase SUPV3L1/SUV3